MGIRLSIARYRANRRAKIQSRNAVIENEALLNQFQDLLTTEEKALIDKKWGGFPVKPEWNYRYHSAFKSVRGFSPDFVPACCCYPYILRALNPTGQFEPLEHKGLLAKYLANVTQPFSPLRRINGLYYDENFSVLSKEVAIGHLTDINSEKELIVKKAKDSWCGQNICFVAKGSSNDAIKTILDSSNDDIVVQTVITQSPITSLLNPTSVNSFRISTLNLNGTISATNIVIKAGGKGKRVDNVGGGNNGCLISISPDGLIAQKGCSILGKPVDIPEIPQIDIAAIVDFAVRAHAELPHIGIVGWDIALDELNKPVLIEANMYWPGITTEQLCSGPFFAERTDEVLDYVRAKKIIK